MTITPQHLTAVMISCMQRVERRNATRQQLVDAGVPGVTVALHPCKPGSPAGTNEAARLALEVAPTDRPLLFLEDDLRLAPDFNWHLTRAMRLDAITYLYLNDSAARLNAHHGPGLARAITERRPIDRGPRRLLRPAACFGTQAVVIPGRLVDTIRNLAHEPGFAPFDSRLQRWLQHHHPHEPVYTSLPHPVQHLNERLGKSDSEPKAERLSMSYGLPTTGTDL